MHGTRCTPSQLEHLSRPKAVDCCHHCHHKFCIDAKSDSTRSELSHLSRLSGLPAVQEAGTKSSTRQRVGHITGSAQSPQGRVPASEVRGALRGRNPDDGAQAQSATAVMVSVPRSPGFKFVAKPQSLLRLRRQPEVRVHAT